MSAKPTVLLVDDDDTFRETVAFELRRDVPIVRTAPSGRDGWRAIEEEEPDVVLLDLNLGDADGLDLLARIQEAHPSVEVVVITAFGTVDVAVQAMRLGAFDFVTKPPRMDALVECVRRAAERRGLRRENQGLRSMLRRRGESELVGTSAAMATVRDLIARTAGSVAPVLITGPSGCGKELVARAIHSGSPRADREMIVVNCAAIPDNLLESEMFGHERGAFTGAAVQRQGLFEGADGTTLFLDEISELSAHLQPKVLRAVQFGEVRRVGGTATLHVDVRIIAATNTDLTGAVEAGTFREDLYYRLNVLSITIPPLRERREDIPVLFRHLARRHGLGYDLEEAHEQVLRGYGWPGNVREMENLVERLRILSPDHGPDPTELAGLLRPPQSAVSLRPIRRLADMERDAIENALAHFQGDREAAAAALGMSVRKLYYRLARYRSDESVPR